MFFSGVKAAYDALAFVTDLYSKLDSADTLTVKNIKENNKTSDIIIINLKGLFTDFILSRIWFTSSFFLNFFDPCGRYG